MSTSLRRRALAVLAGGAVAVSTAVAVAPSASAASTPSTSAATRWLESKLVGGIVTYDQADYNEDWSEIIGYSPKPEYGLTVDTFLAFDRLGASAATRSAILDGLAGAADTYVAGFGISPGAAGKLATAVVTGGRDPRAFGGRNLVADVEGKTIDATGETEGTYGGVGQAWATRALVLSGSAEAAGSLDFLTSKQCANGSFLQDYAADCGSAIEVDSTALAIQALGDAVANGHAEVADELAAAAQALAAAQAADGSFVGNGVPNTNSTGLAAVALSRAGRAAEATKAASWISRHQVTEATGGKLASQTGAIAYDRAALTAGTADGIDELAIDQWIRASTQAAPALAVLSSPKAAASVPRFARSGGTVAVTASGLAAGWSSTARVAGGSTARTVVPAAGRATFTLRVPKGTARRTVAVSDATGRTVASTSVQVLAAKKLRVSSKSKVRRAKVQKVVVRGLAAAEPVRVYYRGKLVKRGVASKSGTYTYRLKVGRKTGKVKVIVRGAYAERNGVRAFRVVK
ncbi:MULTISPECIES: hypothetical protein [Aeromicrobium]|uniref:hypothetical protein n=1 Tax=Aeromicrobium TaxID=2040 RepID=UPI00257C3C00|nr:MULTISPECIES: hypothetical protein [Aeromicrobium]